MLNFETPFGSSFLNGFIYLIRRHHLIDKSYVSNFFQAVALAEINRMVIYEVVSINERKRSFEPFQDR